jgi:hypothetical protein
MYAIEVCQEQSCGNLRRNLMNSSPRFPSLYARWFAGKGPNVVDRMKLWDVVSGCLGDSGSRTRTFGIDGPRSAKLVSDIISEPCSSLASFASLSRFGGW